MNTEIAEQTLDAFKQAKEQQLEEKLEKENKVFKQSLKDISWSLKDIAKNIDKIIEKYEKRN